MDYVNAPRVGVDFKEEIEQTWKVLGCGGTLAGDAFLGPQVLHAVREFAERRHLRVEAAFVRAGGSKYEITVPWANTPEFEKSIEGFKASNFSIWAIYDKQCKGVEEESVAERDRERSR